MEFLSEVMTTNVVSVAPETPLKDLIEIFMQYDFDGVPVVDEGGVLVGLVTQYDLVTGKGKIHLPTFLEIFKNISIYPQDKNKFEQGFEKVESLTAKDLMNKEPLVLNSNTTIDQALKNFIEHHRVNPIPITDNMGRLVGILSRIDLIKLYYKKNWDPFLKENDHRLVQESETREISPVVQELSKFTLVSRTRSRFWLVVSILFAVVGFILAYAIIIRIQIR